MYVEEIFGGKEDTFVYYEFMLEAVTAQRFNFFLKKIFVFLFSETASRLQKRSVSFIIPNAEDGKKRVMVQSQLLDGTLLLVKGST